nr:RecName: Full=Glutathione S-transferase-like protein [Aspergillus aculeatus ATCC 16872]
MPNARILKIQAAAALNNLTLDIPQPFAFGTANKSPEFLQKFPTGKVPAFESSDGEVTLVESDAIAQYVAASGPAAPALLGRNVAEQAAVRQWICFAENEVFRNMMAVVLWRVGMREYDAGVDGEGAKGLEEALAVVERHLAVGEKEFLATEGELSLVDLTLASALFWAFMHYIDEEMRGRFPRVVRWYLRVVGAERVREVFGEPSLVAVRKEASV